MQPGTLYIVGTPIGNLADITLRALETLKGVTAIYAEDTRVSQKLLQRYEIKKPLHSFREAAPAAVVEKTVQAMVFQLKSGESLAYLSDAGTPGVSDPGSYLVKLVGEAGCPVVPIPGPSAFTALLSVAGAPITRPLFVGFLPKKKGHQTLMKNLETGLRSGVADGLVFYESPERVIRLLQELQSWKLPLVVCLGRELTKQFEEILQGNLDEVLAQLVKRPHIKGECSLLVYSLKD